MLWAVFKYLKCMSFPCIIIHGDVPSDLFLLNKNSRVAWNPWHNFIILHKYLYAEYCRVRTVLHETTPGNLYLSFPLIPRQFSFPSSFFYHVQEIERESKHIDGNGQSISFHYILQWLRSIVSVPHSSLLSSTYITLSIVPVCTENAVTKNQNTFVGKQGGCVWVQEA